MAETKLKFGIEADNTQAINSIQEVEKQGVKTAHSIQDVNKKNAKEAKSAQKAGVDAIEEIQNKNREALKNLLGRISLVAIAVQFMMSAISKVGEAIRKYFAQGDVFREMAKSAKVSAESIAYLKAQADSAGVSTEEFNQAISDLANGNTTLEQLSKKWSEVGNAVKTASLAMRNFEQLTRQLNFDEFDKNLSNLSGGISNWWLEMFGSHGKQRAIIQQAVYEGKTLAEAASEAFSKIKWFEGGATFDELRYWYTDTLSKLEADKLETKVRTMNKTAKQLADAEMSAEDRERIFKEQTGVALSNDAIIALAEQIKTAEEKLADSIKDATEVEKKRLEEERKKEADMERYEESARKNEEEINKDIEDTIKKLAKANITDEERSKLLKERYGMDFTGQQIRDWAEDLKSKAEKLDDGLKVAEENKRKADEAKQAEENFIVKLAKAEKLTPEEREKLAKETLGKDLSNSDILAMAEALKSIEERNSEILDKALKQKEEKEKFDADITKLENEIQDVFTVGGGLIGGASYANVIGHDLRDVTKGIREGINESKTQNQTLKKIESLLKD